MHNNLQAGQLEIRIWQ